MQLNDQMQAYIPQKCTFSKIRLFILFICGCTEKKLSIISFWNLFLVLVQHPTRSQPVGQYSKGHAPPYQSPAVTEHHTHLVIIMTPPVPSVLNNLAGVSLATAPPAELDHLLSANSSYRLRSHC